MTLDFEGVLGRHDGWDYGGPGVIECEGCGWKSERLGPEWNGRKDDRHRAHVAAALRAEVGRWLGSDDALYVAAHRESDGLMSALAALAEQVGQVASVGEGEG